MKTVGFCDKSRDSLQCRKTTGYVKNPPNGYYRIFG